MQVESTQNIKEMKTLPQFDKAKPKNMNMYVVELANTRISTEYAQKSHGH